MSHFNIADIAIKFLEQKIGPYEQNFRSPKTFDIDGNLTLFTTFQGEWNYVEKLRKLFKTVIDNLKAVENNLDWSTNNIGTFFLNNLIAFKRNEKKCGYVENLDQLHDLFTLPNQNVSLPIIAYLYSISNFRELSVNSKKKNILNKIPSFVAYPPSLIDLKTSFVSCFKTVTNNNSDIGENFFHDQEFETQENKHSLPCMNLTQYPECIDYCTWHKKLFSGWKKEEFLTVMRYGMPQRKVLLDSIKPYESELAAKLFGKNRIKDQAHATAPMSMAIFCHRKYDGFSGDDIGMFAKVCNDFFPAPTDKGICLTRNLNLNKVMHIEKQYEPIFESDLQKPIEKIKGGTMWSENTLVIFTDGVNDLSKSYPKNQTL